MTRHYKQNEFDVYEGDFIPSHQDLQDIADMRDEISNFYKIYACDDLRIINDPEDDIII